MKTFVRENTWLDRSFMDFGWGNGYVLIHKGHPLHSVDYDDINVKVHGGLTYSTLIGDNEIEGWGLEKEDLGAWCVGFDTCHCDDTLLEWTKDAVLEETKRLKEQLLNYSN